MWARLLEARIWPILIPAYLVGHLITAAAGQFSPGAIESVARISASVVAAVFFGLFNQEPRLGR